MFKLNNRKDEDEPTTTDPTISSKSTLLQNSCFCSKFWPIIALTQLIGINPFTLTHDKSHNDCRLHFQRWSIPNFLNWSGICFHMYSLFLSHWNGTLRSYLGEFFHGTDLYVFAFQSLMVSFEVFFIVVLARLRRDSLAEGFNKLCQAWNEIQVLKNGNQRNLQGRSRVWSWILVAVILVNSAIYVAIMAAMVISRCFAAATIMTCERVTSIYFIIKKLAHALTPLYQLGALGIFAAVCLIAQALHHELGRILKFGHLDHDTIDQVRRTHGKICKATRFITDHFGMTLLCITSTSIVTFVSIGYLIILTQEDMVTYDIGNLEVTFGFFYVRYFQMYLAVLSICLILIPAQMVMNSVSAAADGLCEARLTDLDPKTQFQVSLLLQKVKPRSALLSACNITNIGLTFVASAATNATTYILVLLQFRLSLEPEAGMESKTIATTGQPYNYTTYQ